MTDETKTETPDNELSPLLQGILKHGAEHKHVNIFMRNEPTVMLYQGPKTLEGQDVGKACLAIPVTKDVVLWIPARDVLLWVKKLAEAADSYMYELDEALGEMLARRQESTEKEPLP